MWILQGVKMALCFHGYFLVFVVGEDFMCISGKLISCRLCLGRVTFLASLWAKAAGVFRDVPI